LGFDGVSERRSADVGDAPIVTFNGDFFLQAGEGKRAVELRKGAVDETPGRDTGNNENYRECPNQETKDGPQAVSRRWK
jgi:hypothetical protein